jgi:hydroxymethylpyrimidine/phosphomethylpyrimidine kinase
MKTVLTIAGSDPSGGAGIQADLKTMTVHGVYGMSVITALTAQNTLGVTGVMEVPRDFFRDQLEAVLSDIRPDGVKIGMMPSAALVEETADILTRYEIRNLVTDTVMVSSSGHALTENDAVAALKKRLFPLSAVLTPNIPEAQILWGKEISGEEDMAAAAYDLWQTYGTAVLVKGGHGVGTAVDFLCCDGTIHRFAAQRLENPNTHGTGCTLSSAIACNLAKGMTIPQSVAAAKDYLTKAIGRNLSLGHGIGPLDHMGTST